MDTEPTSWKEILNAPEIPKNYDGKIVKEVEYSFKDDEPSISFIPVLYETKLENEESKWYISNSTASCLQSTGNRDSCMMPIEAVKKDAFTFYFYNYEITKRYAEWYFEKKGKFIYQLRNQCHYHFLLLFFCEDVNWAPFHHDLMYKESTNVLLLKPSSFSVTEITKKLLGREDIETNEEGYSKEEIGFMRVLIALTAYRAVFRNSDDFNEFVENQVNEYNEATGYGISFDSIILKADLIQFYKLSFLRFSTLFPLIYRYFFSLNNIEGNFVRNALKKYQTISFFNIIYLFLKMKDKRLIHFDKTILKGVRLYVTRLKELAPILRDKLPYAELLTRGRRATSICWNSLAAVAYLYKMETYTGNLPGNHESLMNKLRKLIQNVDEKMKTTSEDEENEIYEQFEELKEVHEFMKNIPWNDYKLESKYANLLYTQLVRNNFF